MGILKKGGGMEILLIGICIGLIIIYLELKKINDYAFKLWLFSENIYKPIENASNSKNNSNVSEELLKYIAGTCYQRTLYDSAYYMYGKSWHSLENSERLGVRDSTFHDIAKSMQIMTPDFLKRVVDYEPEEFQK